VSFAPITLCVASQRVFIVFVVCFVMTQSGNFWIPLENALYPEILLNFKHNRTNFRRTDVQTQDTVVAKLPGSYYCAVSL